MDLTDYQMQFLGMIDKKALSWVVRAADFDNYYVVKLVVLKPGPLPTIGPDALRGDQRKGRDRVDTVVPIEARPDMLYRVRLDVRRRRFLADDAGPDGRYLVRAAADAAAASDSSPRAARKAACAGCR